MTKTITVATRNPGKTREIAALAPDYEILTIRDTVPELEIEEDGYTFEENAMIKAEALWNALPEKSLVFADDSGLEIDFFDGFPGIFSARWLGEDTPYSVKNARVLSDMKDVPDYRRGARYVCAIAVITPEGERFPGKRTMEGRIADEARGGGGFGYDRIFLVPELGKTTAELSDEEKNAISHRGKALRAMFEKLRAAGKIS